MSLFVLEQVRLGGWLGAGSAVYTLQPQHFNFQSSTFSLQLATFGLQLTEIRVNMYAVFSPERPSPFGCAPTKEELPDERTKISAAYWIDAALTFESEV